MKKVLLLLVVALCSGCAGIQRPAEREIREAQSPSQQECMAYHDALRGQARGGTQSFQMPLAQLLYPNGGRGCFGSGGMSEAYDRALRDEEMRQIRRQLDEIQ